MNVRTQTYILLGALAAAIGVYLFSRTSAGQSAVGAVSDYLGNLVNGPRGIRNNNPGNIERNSIQWQGMLTKDQVEAAGGTWDPTFVQFDTPANGVRAIGHVLLSKAARGLVTVDSIIRDYSKTDQAAYVAKVAGDLNVDPDQPIDVANVLPAFATSIIDQENGQQPYQPSDIATWVYS